MSFLLPIEEKRKRTKVPSERVFQTKIELGFDMTQQARRNGIPFSIVSFDTLYGRNIQFRADLYQHGYLYIGAVPCSQKIYLQKPIVGVPSSNGRKGKKFTKKRVLFPASSIEVREWAKQPEMEWTQIEIGSSERGMLTYESTTRRVWSVTKKGEVLEEWLPLLSVANVRLLLQATLPLEQLSAEQSAQWVVEYLVKRTQATKSRRKK